MTFKPALWMVTIALTPGMPTAAEAVVTGPVFNREPLITKPYATLPLGAIRPEGWLRDELQRMASGMSGHLDEWYPEVCGPRNAWLGGDGDTWERGPYWIDGLYPLARLLDDKALEAKAQRWIDWTLENQRADGYIGPVELKDADRNQPPPPGAQIHKPDDWWPRMVMLKVLQQHYEATGDPRVVECLRRYFRYQLRTLPDAPLQAPPGRPGGSWWAAQRGGDNLMVVLWFYSLTGETWLLELADLIHRQTVPVTDWFLAGDRIRHRGDQGESLHCVNLAQMMKTPVVRYQQDGDARHLEAVAKAFADIRAFHGQPHGLYGADEPLHGDSPDRGSELCTATEMLFSLETMFEITGDVSFADRAEQIAFNVLPTQCTDDYRARQYFQQANQAQVTFGERDFFENQPDRLVYGLLRGYPCCTCNLHQGWPKFTQHLWMASRDGGIAAMAYAPSQIETEVRGGVKVRIVEETGYPFQEVIRLRIEPAAPVTFPLHLRIPGWCQEATLAINDADVQEQLKPGSLQVVERRWARGDHVELHLPMTVRSSTWASRALAIERGPLLFALRVGEDWSEVVESRPNGVPADAMHRGYLECRPTSPWNYALPATAVRRPGEVFRVETAAEIPANPWTLESAPVTLHGPGIRLPEWQLMRRSAAPPPLSPVPVPANAMTESIQLVPYGASTLRISAFPWVELRE
ncbi:MAG: glycoside hydrolase family 127 protein [Verrucomicrobiales bacterium]|nr:glycoside hydrolase family 127 protein [Verrucomicrobiales bacterium]